MRGTVAFEGALSGPGRERRWCVDVGRVGGLRFRTPGQFARGELTC